MRSLWPHQVFALTAIPDAINLGHRRILFTSPTGAGKSTVICELTQWFVQGGGYVVVYTNRKLLVEQLEATLRASGIDCGVRAAGHFDRREERVQISSLPTESLRTLDRGRWSIHGLHGRCIAIIDEAHINAGQTARHMMQLHLDAGHTILGVTATPLGLSDLYDELIVAGTTSELRACGTLVPAVHYAPTEPMSKRMRLIEPEELTPKEERELVDCKAVWGHVLEWWRKLNPEGKPTILFGPGVAESAWFAQEFYKAGVPSAHIDGEQVWWNGEWYKSDPVIRRDVLDALRTGSCAVLCNRFVLREGVDVPEVAHGIFATTFGSLQSYLQAGGRLLRSHRSMAHVTVQDHGGNWWRYGSLNADRHWELEYTGRIAAGLRWERLRSGDDPEPFRCYACGRVCGGTRCPVCLHESPPGTVGRRVRKVLQSDGSLVEVTGRIFHPRRTVVKADTKKLWVSCYYAARNSKRPMTFAQAYGWFCQKESYFPPRDMPLMPRREIDWFRLVSAVPYSELCNEHDHNKSTVLKGSGDGCR